MPVNSISPSQVVQSTQAIKKTEVAEARKQSSEKAANIKSDNKDKDRKDAVERQSQVQKQQEPNKPVVNTSGQKIGTRINVSA
jgi:hypothetical protein